MDPDLPAAMDALSMDNNNQRTYTIAQLKDEFPSLWYRLHVLILDLRNFSTDDTSRKRLEQVTDISYLGPPYFSTEEAAALRHTQLEPGNQLLKDRIETDLNERLTRRMKKRVASGDFRVCAAHDLAPIFEKAFSINMKKVLKDSQFMTMATSRGLKPSSDGTEWSGLSERKIPGVNNAQSGNKRRKRKGR
ncbi:hypothetical protein EMPG_16801 [Blastomyces silverae]|uniref:Uncharacterized protein n=1 Tax=Blastomyces silverae TaxID=2060906 RepID=A0A0H1BET2_9EURO|nr:hypothetical protein EMPG_16801 [Blastomyces silverae]